MEENKQLQLLDVLGIPLNSDNNTNCNILFSHKEKSLIYSLGSNIIYYNLKKDSKTFLQYFSSNIALLKFINDSENILLIITNSSFPILSIWQIPSFIGIYSQEIVTQQNFEVGQIFLEKINPMTYLILITSKNNNSDNFLYSLNLLKNGKFDLIFFGKLKYIITKINGFNIFYNSNDIVFLMSHNLQYYTIDLKNEKCIMKKNINFSFKLKENTMKISRMNNLLCVLTTKGNCLIYDQNGINKPTINPLGQECFTTCEFCGNSLCIGTSHGNVYVYNIYGFKLKYMINYYNISNIKKLSLINKNNNINKINNFRYIIDNEIIFISINEKIDQIFIIFKDNSFVFMSLQKLLNKAKYNYNLNSLKINTTTFYSFNHSNKILDICINLQNQNNDIKNKYNEIIFYTCSQDNKLIKYYIEQNTDKLQNQYFDLNYILQNSKQNNITRKYFTTIKIHPIIKYKLYAGDNKGFLYIINLNINENDSNFKFRKFNIGTFEIVYLNFSQNGNLLCIGFETGYQLIYKTNKIFECVLKLNEHFLNFENIEYRKNNNHILSYCHFLNNKRHRHCIIYLKDHNTIEYVKLYKSDDGLFLNKKKIMNITIQNTILDIVMHKSENYVIILNDKKQIIINNILKNKTTGVIDLNTQMNKIYNIHIDISGLYLAIICDMNKKDINNNKIKEINYNNRNDLIIIEINTSKVKNYITQMSQISKIIFDNIGKYIILGGELGDISLWRLPGEITSSIKNILREIENDINFWDKYEIRYNNHYKDKDTSLFSINESEKNNYYLDKEDFISNSNNSSKKEERENMLSEEIINNNIYQNYLTEQINDYNKNNRKRNGIKSLNIKSNYNKYKNDLKNIYNEKKIDNILKRDNYIENNYIKNGLNKYPRNKSEKHFYINGKKKENILSKNRKKINYKNNNFFINDNINEISKNEFDNIYNFWTPRDTINIKQSINSNRHSKYPEPLDIDDYLLK